MALERLRQGAITLAVFMDDKNPLGAKRWLWWQHHPKGGRWKYLGRPNWSVAAYSCFRAQFEATPESQRLSRGAPADRTIPYRREFGSSRILHEHVVPQNALLEWLLEARDPVSMILDHNIGAVITAKEDQQLKQYVKHHPNRYDPWLRYSKTEIYFIDNPSRTDSARETLHRHGLTQVADSATCPALIPE